MNKFKNWMRAANGWKRLWLVLSVLGFLYATVLNPLFGNNLSYQSRYEYRTAVERELNNPLCLAYTLRPLAELVEPEFTDAYGSEGCYHIYNQRKFNNPTKVPYTAEDLDSEFQQEVRGEMLALAGIGFVGSLMLSALVYFLGVVVAWVVSGFRARPS